MQTLESKQIVVPEGYFIYDIKMTKAGINKFDEAWIYWHRGGYLEDRLNWVNPDESTWEFPRGRMLDWIDDIETNAVFSESEPVCKIGDQVINFIPGVDFTVEMRSFEADRLARLASNLEEVHQVMQSEMERLGW